ncbi:MAG: class I SAM-dependent methyltransferase [Myxococcota bacterium]
MNVDLALNAMSGAVDAVGSDLGISSGATLDTLIRAQVDTDVLDPEAENARVDPASLARLYELRARHLDWIYETGYLGFFAGNPGMRYSFRRRLEEQMDLMPREGEGSFLEVGCGAGILSLLAAPRFDHVVGTDVSDTALAFARRLAARSRAGNVRFATADVEALPFRKEAFACVACGEVIGHVADPAMAAREMARVLKPGGSLVLSTPCALSPTLWALRVASFLRPGIQFHKERQVDRRVAGLLRQRGEHVDARDLIRVKRHYGFREILALMRSAGFAFREARGAALDLPPAPVIYRRIPESLLGGVRAIERLLNFLGALPRAFAISTIFRFERCA